MNKKELKSILTGAVLSVPITAFAHQDDAEDNNRERLYPTQPSAHLIISHEQECSKVSTLSEQCFQIDQLTLKASNHWLHSTIELKNTSNDSALFSNNDKIHEFTVGIHSNSATLDLGLYDLKHPVHDFFDENRMIAPISLDKSLRQQSIKSQAGIRAFKRFDLSDSWSVSTSISASKTRNDFFPSNDKPAEIYGQQNRLTLLGANDLSLDDAGKLLQSFEAQTQETITGIIDTIRQDENSLALQSLQELIQNIEADEDVADSIRGDLAGFILSDEGRDIADQIETITGQISGLPDIQGAVENSELSQTAKDFTQLASWLYLRSESKRNDIVNSINYNRIANDINNYELSDKIQSSDILPYFEEYLSPEEIEIFETTFDEQLAILQGQLDENATIDPAQLRCMVKDAVDEFYTDLDKSIKDDPQRYHSLLNQNLQHITDLHDVYQDKTTYYANAEIRYEGDNHDWRFGLHGHKRQSDFLTTEERYGLYSISSWDISDKLNLTSILSLDYYKNRYGYKQSDDEDNIDGNILVYERLKYDINNNVSVYGAIGGTATLLDGAFLTAEFGAQACTQALGGDLCVHGAYEQNKSLDGYEHRIFDVESAKGTGTKLGVTYEYSF